MIITLVGLQWGDEGKGKIADLLSQHADWAIRFQGGNNAGHTIKYQDKKFVLHHIPSGICQPKCKTLLGGGMVIDLPDLCKEIEELQKQGINCKNRIFISEIAHLILPTHKIKDRISEQKKNTITIGTTGKGIGPAYADKVIRRGIRVCDLNENQDFKKMFYQKMKQDFAEISASHQNATSNIKLPSIKKSYEELMAAYLKIKENIYDSHELLHVKTAKDKNILLEGAQGSLLDIDYGTYPYVTSSSTVAGMSAIGSGVGLRKINAIFGIFKAYTTRVGEGAFPTELKDQYGKYLQTQGGEIGSTTGRSRRCGWLDLCLLRKTIAINDISHLILMKLDVLDQLEEIKVCTSYKTKEGKKLLMPPNRIQDWNNLIPQYKSFKGWQCKTSQTKSIPNLPRNCQSYINFLQKSLKCPIIITSVSPKREDNLIKTTFFFKQSTKILRKWQKKATVSK